MKHNPGLQPYDMSGYQGLKGINFFEADPVLRILLETSQIPADQRDATRKHLSGFGELASGILNDLAVEAHLDENLGQVVQFDRAGNRIDEIRYSAPQKEIRRLAYEYGIVNLDYHSHWRYPFTVFHRMALAYIANKNGESGYTCPLAMTEGMIRVIREIGTPEQQAKYLPLIAGPGSKSHFMCGQYVTERTGGSNVAANRTIAVRNPEGRWILNGEKWFCSNPGDLWVTTARIGDSSTIGLFLVSRTRADGSLNGCRILRKKNIIGSRGKLTVEAVYEDAEAEELGRPSHGLANLIRHVISVSRVHVAVAALGMSHRAFMEARAYTAQRFAYGRPVGTIPVTTFQLARMNVRHIGAMIASFRIFEEQNLPSAELLTPLMKYAVSSHATSVTHEAMLLHGGAGILSDYTVLPRILNDAIINETWEGVHSLMTEHVLKAWDRHRVQQAFTQTIESAIALESEEDIRVALAQRWNETQNLLRGTPERKDILRMEIADQLWLVTMAASVIRLIHAPGVRDQDQRILRLVVLSLLSGPEIPDPAMDPATANLIINWI